MLGIIIITFTAKFRVLTGLIRSIFYHLGTVYEGEVKFQSTMTFDEKLDFLISKVEKI